MEIICAWCDKKLGEKEGEGSTHGICDKCLNLYFPHLADRIRQALEVDSVEEIYAGGKSETQRHKAHR